MDEDYSLRPLRRDDAPEVLEAFASDAEMDRQGTVRDLDEAKAYVARLLDPPGRHHAWAIAGPSDRLVGLVCVDVDDKNHNGWFWYWVNAAHRGKGLAAQAATAVASWALSDGELARLELGHRANNPASGAVARAAGFVPEGVERAKFLVGDERIDVLTYGRLRDDPWPSGGLRFSHQSDPVNDR